MKLLKKTDVCEVLNLSARCLEGMVSSGRFPRGQRLGRFDYWTEECIDKWKTTFFLSQNNWRPGM